ncbi:MAG: TlpA disulfide reductase family protein [Chloroflexota bacterium]
MQTTQRRFLSLTILLLGMAWIGLSADRSGASANGLIPAPQEGFLAPEFTLASLDGATYRLSDLRGRAVLVNLWASWCLPCRAEMPAIQRVYEQYKDSGFVVLAVNSTWQDDVASAESFVAEHGLTFPILLDTDGTVSRLYELRALPTSFFVGRDGRIRKVVVGGPMSETSLRAQIESLLEEGAP